jgi:hypothetical protein
MWRSAIVLLFALALPLFALDPVPRVSKPLDNATGVPIEDLKLEFDAVTGVTSYTVQMSPRSDFSLLLPLKNQPVKFDDTQRFTVEYEVAIEEPVKLQPSTTYYWRIIAECPEGRADCVPSRSRTFNFTTELSAAAFTRRGFSLSRTVEGDTAKKPASFKYAFSDETGDVYTATYALQWRPSENSLITHDFHDLYWSMFHEGVLSSDDEAKDTAVRFGGQLVHDWSIPARSAGLHSTLALLHEADQSYDTRKNLLEVSTTPSLRRLYIGTATGSAQSQVQFMWEPTAIVTFGRTMEVADSAETNETVQRYALRLATTAKLNFLERLLNFGDVTLTAGSTGWLLPNEEEERHSLFEGALAFGVAENVSVGFEYKRGKQPPEFKGGQEYGLAVGVKF